MLADRFATPFSDRGHGLASILVKSDAYELVLVDTSTQDQSSTSVLKAPWEIILLRARP
jgi:hypothetical protein